MTEQQKTAEALSNQADFSTLPKHYTDAQIAAYWDVDVRYVRALIASGDLDSFPVGKRRKVTEDQLRRYMDKMKGSTPCQTETTQEGASVKTEATSASGTATNAAPSGSTRAKVGRPFASQALTRAILQKRS
jgi:excisionase family DNA binding protein